jgi:prepilin-type processing-associated H-X9-DG protein
MNQEAQNQREDYQPPRYSVLALAAFAVGLLGLEPVVVFLVESAHGGGYSSATFTLGIEPNSVVPIMLCAAVIGLVLGLLAQVQISRNAARLKGQFMAQVGTAASLILLVMSIAVPAHELGPRPPLRSSCLSNLKQIGSAISMYRSDWDDRFPLVSGPGREFERVFGLTWNYRTGRKQGGEYRWFQDLIAPYLQNKHVFMCPAVGEQGKWEMMGVGTIVYYQNRHGGFRYAPRPAGDGDPHGEGAPNCIGVVAAPSGSNMYYLAVENDPPTSYWFSAVVEPRTPSSTASKAPIVVSGQRISVCADLSDAPLVWDTPCGRGRIAHGDVINVCYADGHVKPYQIPKPRAREWRETDFRALHGSDGWYTEK